MAVCGIAVTILFGLGSLNIITTEQLQYYLSIDTGIAITIFIGYGIWNFSITRAFIKPEYAIIKATSYLGSFQNHFIAISYDINKVDLGKLEDLFVFVMLIEGSNKILVYNELTKITKMKRMGKFVQEEIQKVIGEWETGISDAIKAFQEIKNELEKEEWKEYKPLIENLINYKK